MSTPISQRSFAAGEIAPALYARVDLSRYAIGARTVRNLFVARAGGLKNRPGTGYIDETRFPARVCRLIPWVFNSDQAYVVELGHQYIEFIRSGARITETAQNITAATNANPCVLTIAGHGYSNGDDVYVTGVGGMTELNGRRFRVAGATANTFQLNYVDATAVNSSAFTAFTSGGTAARIYKISSPYVEGDLAAVQYSQADDVMTLTHYGSAPREISRSAHTSWTLATASFGPGIGTPGSVAATGAADREWGVTALNSRGEESLMASNDGGATGTLSWAAVTDAVAYNIYRNIGVGSTTYRLLKRVLGSATTTYFELDSYQISPRMRLNHIFDNTLDIYEEDQLQQAPTALNRFGTASNHPAVVAHYQGRRLFAATTNNPQSAWASWIDSHGNYYVPTTIIDSSPVIFTMAGNQVNAIRHMLNVGRLIILTSAGEWIAKGDGSGALLPTAINLEQQSHYGAAALMPVVVGETVLFLQARSSVIRDLLFNIEIDGYRGNDLTNFSSHLFDAYTISAWAYQQIPHSNVWIVRSDGKLLCLTYVREQALVGWSWHDTDGTFESVASVPESTEDAVYFVVKRTVNGATRRYVERFKKRDQNDVEDYVFMDASLTYDGWHTGATTMTLSGGTAWTYDELLTLTASVAATFTSTDVGNEIHLVGSDGTLIRFSISAYTSGTVVQGFAHATVPATMRSVAITTWAEAVDEVTGLWHLEGETVSILGDGHVVASPNNSDYTTHTVTNGTVTFSPVRCYAVVHVGLPYVSDLETLDVEAGQGPSLSTRMKRINEVTVHLENSRGVWIGSRTPSGDTNAGLFELAPREGEEDYDEPPTLITDKRSVGINPEWNSNGRIFARQVDPLPLSLLAVTPNVDVGGH